LFCNESSDAVINVLKSECDAGHVAWRTPLSVEHVRQDAEGRFTLDTNAGPIAARALVVATGGLSIPKIGATDFAYRLGSNSATS
jgi:predicted flavoprotein YhiN